VTQDQSEIVESPRANLFSDLSCKEILYRITIAHDKFNYTGFADSVKQSPEVGEWADVVCPSKNADYHVHIAWTNKKTTVMLQVGFYAEDGERKVTQKDIVYAEEAIPFLGKFFLNDNSQAHIHAEFEFRDNKKSKFPLPIRTTIGPYKTEIDGLGVKLSDTPSGISQVWIMQRRDKRLSISAYADKKITFGSFSVESDLKDLLGVIEPLTEARNDTVSS
jgi:hypothetical protein